MHTHAKIDTIRTYLQSYLGRDFFLDEKHPKKPEVCVYMHVMCCNYRLRQCFGIVP